MSLSLGAWSVASVSLAFSGLLTFERRAFVPLAILGSVLALTGLYRAGGSLRRVADAIDLRALVLFHSIRAPLGVAFFVWEATRGLDATFVAIAGTGDLVVGLLAPLASLALPLTSLGAKRFVLLFNTLGLLDILLVVMTAFRLLILSDHPESMSALLSFPGPLLPTFIVPLVIATHLAIFARLR